MSPSANNNVVHRPGALKQQNKPFKTGRHRSQYEIKRSTKGIHENLLEKMKFFCCFKQVEWQKRNMLVV